MANVLIAYNNRIDEAVISGGSWTSGLPLANLQTRELEQVARSADLAQAHTCFDIALAKSRPIRVFGLINHNLTTAAKFRLRLSDVADFSVAAYDSGLQDAWPALWLPEQLEWEDDNWWSCTLSEEQRAGYRWNLIRLLRAPVRARYLRLELVDAGNPDGYVQAGRVFVAEGWQPVRNMAYGASIGYEDRTEIQETLSGAEKFGQQIRYRVASFSLNCMSPDEAMSEAFELQRQVGISGEVLYVWNPDETLHFLRRSFLGRMRKLDPINFPTKNIAKTAFETKELL